MKGWPFKRLLIGPAPAIAQAASSTGKVKTYGNPQGRYTCESGQFCQCNGADDCISLGNADACVSLMSCDGAGDGLKCYCPAK